jgi:two-component system LytT family response regulator
MRVVIVDDEPIARQNVRDLIEKVRDIEIVGEADNGADAVALILQERPDLAVLDLQMPELDGFGVARALQGDRAPLVIYVTAFAEHALRAFEAGAIDYLLKPVRSARMKGALEKARTQLKGLRRAGRPARQPAERITGRAGEDLHLFRPDEVVAFAADRDVVYLHTGTRRYYAEGTLKELEERLPSPPFVRVHRGTIINTDHIRKISPLSSKRWLLTMSNGFEAVVSKRMKSALRGVAG